MNPQRELYTVKHNDTLWKIARDHNKTVEELKKLNGIKNPNALREGQKIALHKEAVGGFRVLLLDQDRNPLQGVNYRLDVGGKRYTGETSDSGETQRIVTDSPYDVVHIWVQRIDGSWKEVAIVMSGFGDKLTVLVSGHIKVPTKTEKHPDLPPNTQPDTKERPKPKHGPENPPKTSPNKSAPGPLPQPTHTPDGKPITPVEGDIPNLDDFLDHYAPGADLTKSDIEAAAKDLKCDPGLIYAIAKQESAASSFAKLGNRIVPKILYERHKFRDLTRPSKHAQSPYEEKYRDICGPQYIRVRKNKEGKLIHIKTGAVIAEDDAYGLDTAAQYKRLCKAYLLDQSAALQACSWGKFQIMGFNYKAAGFNDVKAFTKALSRSDAEHMKAFLKFAKSNKILLNGLREKNFEKIAAGHNGDNWRSINPEYASNIEKFYKEYDIKK